MPLSWNEIRSRAHEFSKLWEDETSERAAVQSFWDDFFHIFGIERRRVAVFEKHVEITRAGQKLKHGRIDAFWKDVLLVEHKSRGQDLNRAFAQAADYFGGLPDCDLPRYILVSDFARFRLYDLELPSPQPSPHTRGEGAEASPLPPAGEGGQRPGEGAFTNSSCATCTSTSSISPSSPDTARRPSRRRTR